MIEKDIQKSILAYLQYKKGWFVWKNKNQGTYNPVTKTFYNNSTKKGISDILGMTTKGRFIAVEVKTIQGLRKFERNKFKLGTTEFYENQFLEQVKVNGGIGILATSVED